jgi:murein DD-endopeptidase MepM/ murein hydrolase activator NlpD
MKKIVLIILIFIGILGCKKDASWSHLLRTETHSVNFDTINFTVGFDFPVGKPNAKGYNNAQKFTKNNHLGEDWNGNGGGDSDLGDPIYSIANGYVVDAKNHKGSWGNVIRIIHYISENNQIESLYAHCNAINVKKGDYVSKGDKIGTIGNNNKQYWAHLHLELRSEVGLPIGGGYSSDTKGYLNPTAYIKNNR